VIHDIFVNLGRLPIFYILQAEPMACAIRGTDEIKGIAMPGSENVLESKICMFADDTQVFSIP
jgi:hypothetical protein